MSKKGSLKIFRITYIVCILILLTLIIYLKLLVRVSSIKTTVNSQSQSVRLPIYSPSPSPYIPPAGVSQNKNLDKSVFKNSNIYFEFPSKWNIYTTDSSKSDPLSSLLFKEEDVDCNSYIGSFQILETDSKVPSSYKIALVNKYGTSDQISKITNINGLTVGMVTQPTGDGSGGYEPGITIDFLSNSKKFHYYFSAKKGCRNSYDETFVYDILPILNTVRLFD